jgi:hypothetical protein
MEDELMNKAKVFNFLVSGKAAVTFRVAMLLTILIVSLLVTGAASAGTIPGTVGS